MRPPAKEEAPPGWSGTRQLHWFLELGQTLLRKFPQLPPMTDTSIGKNNIEVAEFFFDCSKQDVASFRIQHIGVEGERIGTKAFGSGVQSLLAPSGYCYPSTFGDEQLRGGQSYSAIAARDQGGFTLKLHLEHFALRFVYQSGVSANR